MQNRQRKRLFCFPRKIVLQVTKNIFKSRLGRGDTLFFSFLIYNRIMVGINSKKAIQRSSSRVIILLKKYGFSRDFRIRLQYYPQLNGCFSFLLFKTVTLFYFSFFSKKRWFPFYLFFSYTTELLFKLIMQKAVKQLLL